MTAQVRERLRPASVGQVAGRGHHDQLRVLQVARDHGGIKRGTAADRQVESFLGEVDIPITQVELDPDLGIAARECRQ